MIESATMQIGVFLYGLSLLVFFSGIRRITFKDRFTYPILSGGCLSDLSPKGGGQIVVKLLIAGRFVLLVFDGNSHRIPSE